MIGWAVFCLAVAGCLMLGTFLAMHRPSRWLTLRTAASMGWEIILFIVFVRLVVALLINGFGSYADEDTDTFKIWFGLFSLLLVDVFVGLKLYAFQRYQRAFDNETDRLNRESRRQR